MPLFPTKLLELFKYSFSKPTCILKELNEIKIELC